MIAALAAGGETELPEWYVVFSSGKGELADGVSYTVDEQAWEMFRAAIERRGVEIVIDYEHQALSGNKAPAAGWCRQWRWTPGVGIEARIDWTEEAAGYLKSGEYRYFSPVFYINKSDGRLAGAHSLALTNTPKTNHLKPLLAKLGAQQQQEEAMLKKLLAKLGLGEDATEEQALSAIDGLRQTTEKEVIPEAVVAALGIEGTADASTVVASIHALKQAPKGMVSKAEFDALQARITERDAAEAVAGAMAAGKITPDQKDWAMAYAKADPNGFATFVAKAAVVVPIQPLGDQKKKADDAEIGAATLQVAKLMGVAEEDIKKYGA